MLKWIPYSSQRQKFELLNLFKPESETWLVPDLRSKLDIQRFLIEKNAFVESQSLYRMSEFILRLWRKSAVQGGNFRLLSNTFLQAALKDFLQTNTPETNEYQNHHDQLIFQLIQQMSPILCHSNGAELLQQWFAENPQAYLRWGSYYEKAQQAVDHFLSEGLLLQSWLIHRLLDEVKLEQQWTRPLVVDLGIDLSRAEAELILTLSQFCEIRVLEPQLTSGENYRFLKKGYEDLKQSLGPVQLKREREHKFSENPAKPAVKLVKAMGPLAEVSWCTHQIRRWIEKGTLPANILLVLPDVEAYWPWLESFFSKEGIPCSKSMVVRAQQIPFVSEWIASLRLSAQQLSAEDLEIVHFSASREAPKVNFAEFESVIGQFIDEEDLNRREESIRLFRRQYATKKSMNQSEFVLWMAGHWRPQWNLSLLEGLVKKLVGFQGLSDKGVNLNWQASTWIFLLERMLAEEEITLIEGNPQGVQLAAYESVDLLMNEKTICLGLGESSLSVSRRGLLDSMEIESIAEQLGFYLSHPEIPKIDFQFEWLMQSAVSEIWLSYPQTNFDGNTQAPYGPWLALAADEKVMEAEHGHTFVEKEISLSLEAVDSDPKALRILQDLGMKESERVAPRKPVFLSASSVKKYLDCPFKYAAEKILGLEDLSAKDVELDPRSRGRLIHKLFEKLLLEIERPWDVNSIGETLELLKSQMQENWMDPKLWQHFKGRFARVGEKFVKAEREFFKTHPKAKVIATEKNFQIQFNENITLRGQIDRIDGDDSGHLVVRDYKTSQVNEYNFTQWLKSNQLQTGLYAFLIDQGLIEDLKNQTVVGAVYYFYKNFERDFGLKLIEGKESFFSEKKLKYGLADKTEFYSQLQDRLRKVFSGILEGQIEPKPVDPKICPDCHWRFVCRAPHLMI